MRSNLVTPIIILAFVTLCSSTLSSQDYPIHVAPMATSCVENSAHDIVNCTDNLIYEFLLSDIDSSVCNHIDSGFQYSLKIDIDQTGKISYTNVSSWNDQGSGCKEYFHLKASKISDVIKFNPALDGKNKPIIGAKYFDFTYPIPQKLDSLREAGSNWVRLENLPRFIGCEHITGNNKDIQKCSERTLLQFLYNNLEYPIKARKKGVQGQVFVQFVVKPDGMITDINIVRDIGAGCGQAVIDMVKKMNQLSPPFVPGKQLGKAVKVLYTLPVTFRLEN